MKEIVNGVEREMSPAEEKEHLEMQDAARAEIAARVALPTLRDILVSKGVLTEQDVAPIISTAEKI